MSTDNQTLGNILQNINEGSITSLVLEDNDITDEEAIALAEALGVEFDYYIFGSRRQ